MYDEREEPMIYGYEYHNAIRDACYILYDGRSDVDAGCHVSSNPRVTFSVIASSMAIHIASHIVYSSISHVARSVKHNCSTFTAL